jgi:putative RecB family exonuclease
MLSTYETCPLQFRLKYIDRIKVETEESVEAFLGKRVHEAFEKLYLDLRYAKLMTLDEVFQYYFGQWDKNWNDTVAIRKKGLTAENYRETGKRCVEGYYRRYAPFNQGVTLWIEGKAGPFSLSGDNRYMVHGYVDRLDRVGDGVYEIHDYKTSGSLPMQEKLDEDRQLALYEIGVREKFQDVKEVRLVWHYLVFDTEIRSSRTPEQLDALKKETIALIDAIESDKEFKYRESALCDWCDYPKYCPARKHLVKVEALPPEEFLAEDGVSLVNRYVSVWKKLKELKAEQEGLKEAIASYARREGAEAIMGSGYSVKVSFKEHLKFPGKNDPGRDELEEAIIDAGLWNELSELDAGALVKALEEGKLDKEVAEIIRRFAAVEESVRVGAPRVVREEK